MTKRALGVAAALWLVSGIAGSSQSQLGYEVRQLTFGPAHHFYGYIGHVGNTPYSADGKYLVALRTTFQDRMPRAEDAADIVLLDVAKNYAEVKVEETRGWNPQQGAMIYWNPEQPSRQFFFNDRDPKTGKVFTALYDIVDRKRVREFRFDQTPVANGGVKQDGGAFAAINYARMARLRPVTGYPGTWDWTEGVNHPQDDGLFVVDARTGERKLIVSFRQMRDALVAKHPRIDGKALFLNHTLWNREGDRIFFFVRADFGAKDRINVPMTVRPDGSELVEQRIFIGGHPEWDFNSRMIGRVEDKLVLYDTLSQQIVETIGGPEIFRDPEGDTALSRDGEWIVNGAPTGATMHFTVLRRADRAFFKTEDFSRAGYTGGDLRIDPAPTWNREGDRFAFPALAKDGTRQMFEVRVIERSASPQAAASGRAELPKFTVDPSWPKIPSKWQFGQVASVAVGADDHVWILQRPSTLEPHEKAQAAPPVLEFDAAGNFLRGWGGPGAGYQWPASEHGLFVDHNGFVWIGGNGADDHQILKFTRDGKFVMQIGKAGQSRGNSDTQNLNQPADAFVHPETNELFVADGYGNRRIIVFDADTGEFKRMWGAFGNRPTDDPPNPAPADAEERGASQFVQPVHAARVSSDGLVYVSDRGGKRVQVFTIDGKYLNQVFIGRECQAPECGNGTTAASTAFSTDPKQRFLYVGNRSQAKVMLLDRATLRVLDSFGQWGSRPGEFGTLHHMATDSKGNLYVTEVTPLRPENRRVQKFVLSAR